MCRGTGAYRSSRKAVPATGGLNEPALLHGGSDETREQGMGLERAAFKLGVELDSDEPFAVRTFDDFRQLVVRRHTGEDQAGSFERVAIMDIDLVAMPMPLADEVL